MIAAARPLLVGAAVPVLLALSAVAGGHPAAAAPAAPATAGTVLTIYPTANTHTASPKTSISLRGLPAGQIGTVSVHGSQSGSHSGHVRADSDGNGESFLLNSALVPGEQVTVTAQHALLGSTATDHRQITFTVSRPVDDPTTAHTDYEDPADEKHYLSAPQLSPPVVRVVKGALNPSVGDLFLAAKRGSGGDGPTIVRPDGSVVWYHRVAPYVKTYDFRVQTYRGRPVLTWFEGLPASGHSRGTDTIMNSSYRTIAHVKAGNGYVADHHEFQLTPWGTALITVYQPVHWNLASVGGPADGLAYDSIFQEIDIPTGNVLAEWHSLDHVGLADTYYTSLPTPFDYFHINSLDSRSRGYVLVSGRATHTVYQVEEATGRVIWRLGGKHSSFSGAGAGLSSQHDARFLDGTDLSVFDNGSGVGPPARAHSRAVVVHLDSSAATATLTTDDEGSWLPSVSSQGSAQVMPDGYLFVGWAGQHAASEFDRSGREIYRSTLPDQDETYREFRFPWSATPKTRPAVAASASGSSTMVWASWNGATDVAAWRVLTGSSRTNVTAPAGVHSRYWFETGMSVSGTPAYVRVQALAADGSVLATSAVRAVRLG